MPRPLGHELANRDVILPLLYDKCLAAGTTMEAITELVCRTAKKMPGLELASARITKSVVQSSLQGFGIEDHELLKKIYDKILEPDGIVAIFVQATESRRSKIAKLKQQLLTDGDRTNNIDTVGRGGKHFSADNPVDVLAKCLELKAKEVRQLRDGYDYPQAPDELLKAFSRYASVVAHNPEKYRRINRLSSIAVWKVPYTGLEGELLKEQFDVYTAISKCCDTKVDLIEDLEFQRSVNSTNARDGKVMCPFPFFLVSPRRDIWGVLPYGLQTNLTVVFHRDHPFASARRTPDQHEWLSKLIQYTITNKGYMYWVNCYSQYDIINEHVEERGDFDCKTALIKINHCVSSIEDAFKALRTNGNQGRSFFVIDTADVVDEFTHRGEFRFEAYKHEVNVPVGVGFSLPCAPMLLVKNRWETILRTAGDLFGKEAKRLADRGISIR